jgi:hypothetical protein
MLLSEKCYALLNKHRNFTCALCSGKTFLEPALFSCAHKKTHNNQGGKKQLSFFIVIYLNLVMSGGLDIRW